MNYINSLKFLVTYRLIQNGLSINGVVLRTGWADMTGYHRCDHTLVEINVHVIYHCTQVHIFCDYIDEMTARIDPEQLVSIHLAYVCDNISLPCSGMRLWVFLTMLDVAKMLVWTL